MLYDAHGRALERANRLGFVPSGPAFVAAVRVVASLELADAIGEHVISSDGDNEAEDLCSRPTSFNKP